MTPVARVGATQGQRSLRGTGVRARSRCAHRPRLHAGRACPGAPQGSAQQLKRALSASKRLSAVRTPRYEGAAAGAPLGPPPAGFTGVLTTPLGGPKESSLANDPR